VSGHSCNRCGHRWSALGACHCTGCCRRGAGERSTFSGLALFDRHRSSVGEHGRCIAPESIRSQDGQPVMWHRDGMWRGPELTTEQRVAAGWLS
jgi:hypothetical protein